MSTSIGREMELSREGHMLIKIIDSAILKQVLASHTDHLREFDVGPVINLTEQILIQAIVCSTGGVLEKEERPQTTKKLSGLAELDTYNTAMIQRISREAKAMELLNILSSYSWHAKVVLVLAGFAVNFRKFCLSVQPCPADALSKSLARLRKLPNLGDIVSPLKCHYDKLRKLVRASLDVTKCIAEVWNLSFHYISEDQSVISDVNAPITDAVYWTIKSIVTCSSQIDSIMRLRNEYIPSSTEASELSTLAFKVNSIHEQLMNKLDVCYKYIEQKIILHLTFPNEDNLRIHVDMGKQRRKHMLLLVSDLDMLEDEIQLLDRLYRDQAMRSERLYEMVWVPVVSESSWNRSNQRKFKKLKSTTPWYSFQQPLSNQKLIELMRKNWHFEDRPVVVVQDPQGKLSSTDVIRKLWFGEIWRSHSLLRERQTCGTPTFGILRQLLVTLILTV
ncbi:hypothetical protein L6164_033179 [Bauhinia variegata]|uniref:Uncharacterized protein n=1 Tax=Bauhinia variegata TaxID=167791 RepID=A0ACB9KRN1_BAUVA|nr:hypothetical protein L6164_033179 [Bauhinia variegata]